MPTLVSIEVFVKVAELGSFTKAAEGLSISRTMASKHVRDLEGELGAQLLNRTTRTVALTEAGTEYLERASEALAQLRAAGDRVSEACGIPKGHLRVSAPLSFGLDHIVPVLNTFRANYPHITIDLDLTDRTVDILAEGYDVALRIGELKDSSLRARKLAPIKRLLCASPVYLARAGIPHIPSDLRQHDCLDYSYMAERSEWRFDGPKGAETVHVDGQIKANNGNVLAQLAAAGHGIISTASFIASPYLSDGRLVTILDGYAPPALNLYAVYPSGRLPPLKLRSFIDAFVSAYTNVPPWDRQSAHAEILISSKANP